MNQPGELGMVGTTFRRAGAQGLAYYTLLAGDTFHDALRALQTACGCVESVYLATCNRVEFFFAAAPGTTVVDVRRRFFSFFAAHQRTCSPNIAPAIAPFDDARRLHAFAGEGAVDRLFVVASALDSMVPGEAQILGQVKGAYSRARDCHLAAAQLGPVFEAAFSAAKRVRQHTTLGAGRVSMLSLTLGAIKERIGQAENGLPNVVISGAGDMAEQCGRALRGEAVTLLFVNRTLLRAQDLAQRFSGQAMALAQYLAAPPATDVLITATASPVPLFEGAFFKRLQHAATPTQNRAPPLVIDLAVPADVDVAAAHAAGASLYDVDRMQATAQAHSLSRQEAVSAARELLDDALDHYRIKEAERAMGQAIAQVRAHGQDTLMQQLLTLKAALPQDVVHHSWPHIERFANGLFGQLAHASTRGLKALAHDHGPQALNAYLRGAGLQRPPPPRHAPKEPS